MASKTFSQLYTDALTQTDELTGTGSATAQLIIKRGINESYADAAAIRDWKTLENSATISAVASTNEYTPVTSSTSVCRIRRIESVLDETSARYLDETQREVFERSYPYVNTSTDIGTPTIWYESGYTSSRDIKIKLYKVPDGARTYRVFFYEEPLELVNDTDVPRIPDQWHYGLNYLGIAKYYEYQKDLIVAGYYRQMHEEWKQKLLTTEYGFSDSMPSMRPQMRPHQFTIGKIGRIYNR